MYKVGLKVVAGENSVARKSILSVVRLVDDKETE